MSRHETPSPEAAAGSGLDRAILRIAVPAITGYLGVMVYDLVNIFWLSRLGSEALAGVASAGYLVWAVEAVLEANTIGCGTLVAQSVGAGDEEGARRVSADGMLLGLALSVGLSASLYGAGPSILAWLGLSPAAHGAAWSYFGILSLCIPVLHMNLLGNQFFNARGETRTTVAIMTAGLLLNALLDPLLIFGWFGFPELGVAGAALSTAAGLVFTLLLRLAVLRRRGHIPPLSSLAGPALGTYAGRILRVGAPTAAAHAIWTMVYPLLTTIITRFGMAPMAGMSVAHRIESLPYFACLGFSIATATLVGQSVGRGDFAAARRIAYRCRGLVTLFLLPVTAVFVLWPEALLSLAAPDPEAVAHGASYLRKVGLLEVFLGWELVFEGGFNGLGATKPYMLISVPLTFGRYPAAWLLVAVLGCGVDAVWWCIAVSTMLKGLLMSLRFGRAEPADLGIASRAVAGEAST